MHWHGTVDWYLDVVWHCDGVVNGYLDWVVYWYWAVNVVGNLNL